MILGLFLAGWAVWSSYIKVKFCLSIGFDSHFRNPACFKILKEPMLVLQKSIKVEGGNVRWGWTFFSRSCLLERWEYTNKMIWTVQNHFGTIEGQGMYYLSLRNDFRREWQNFFVRYLDVLLRSNGILIGYFLLLLGSWPANTKMLITVKVLKKNVCGGIFFIKKIWY